MRDHPAFIVPHSDHGDVECCGLIMIEVRGDKADLQCNECGVILKTVSAAEAEQVLGEMEAAQPSCAEGCPYCGHKNTFTGFTDDLVVGVSGFGDAVHDALRELADNLLQEAVRIEIADQAELPFTPTEVTGGSIQTNVVRLYHDKGQNLRFCRDGGFDSRSSGIWRLGPRCASTISGPPRDQGRLGPGNESQGMAFRKDIAEALLRKTEGALSPQMGDRSDVLLSCH
jgi:hypothetical protein